MYAVKKQSVALAALAVRQPTGLTKLIGAAPTQRGAESVLKQQSTPGLPGIMVRDLSTGAGERVTIEALDVLGGYPIMGDQIREGKGSSMNIATMEARIDLASKVVNGGAKMSQKRTEIQLRGAAMAQLMGYFPRLLWQRALVHMAGARGVQADNSWCLPLQSHADFASMLINPVLAPTYNRHLVLDSTSGVIQGGAQLASVDTTDTWKLSSIDAICDVLEASAFKLQPVKIPGDPAANDEPIQGVLMLDPLSYSSLVNDTTSGQNIRNWQALAMERARLSAGANQHPLFRGEIMMWRNLLIKKMDHSIFFRSGDTTKIITAANRLTATESDVTIPSISGYRVSRSLLLGAQAFGVCLGSNQSSGLEAAFQERSFDYGAKYEAMGEWMGGETKLRFKFANSDGNLEPTDHGIYVIDAVTRDL